SHPSDRHDRAAVLGWVDVIGRRGARGSGVSSEQQKYLDYARECVRLAGHAETPEFRDKLIDLARVWMDAAMAEEEAESERARSLPSQGGQHRQTSSQRGFR